MPERSVYTETLRVGAPVTAGGVTLVPIERVTTHSQLEFTRAWLSVTRQPYTLVLRDATGVRTVNIDPAAVSLEQLRETIPELTALLASI